MTIIDHATFYGAGLMVLIIGVVLYLVMTMGDD
jgi:hypothetical protein